ncbi:MAG TPA: [protein-PII] uridylyltransferase [Myxococcales bacterium]|jgi:[protein-PII] uridylyltransferase
MAFLPPQLPEPRADDVLAALGWLPDSGEAPAAEQLAGGREAVRTLHREGFGGVAVVGAMTEVVDRVVRSLAASLGGLGTAALVALGGYGRRELAPHSDVDLMLLLPDLSLPGPLAGQLPYALWDLGLEVGWSVRTGGQCAALAAQDHTVATALLDARLVQGPAPLFAELVGHVRRGLLADGAQRLAAAKIRELRERRERFGATVFRLEPDLKHGEGGLRDLQAIGWIARVRFGADGLPSLLERGLLPEREAGNLLAARDFLLRVRNELHLQAGRRDDRLTFDRQLAAARDLGYRDGSEGLAVERFMRHVWLAAKAVESAADALIDRCAEADRRRPRAARAIEGEFEELDGRMEWVRSDLPDATPEAVLRLFEIADREGLSLTSGTRDRVSHAVAALPEAGWAAPQVGRLFAGMLSRPGTAGTFLGAMHELGVLERVLPELADARGRAQHDLYHLYPVDVHCLLTAKRLYALRNGELAEQEPVLTRRMQALEQPVPLYLAGLLHDAAKSGTPGHAERGAVLVRAAALRLGLAAEEVAEAEFLVLQHLAMSHVSQRRDLSDPATIADFARRAGSPRRLLMLHLLTYADMGSVAPGTWNAWRARLLEELWARTLAALEGARPPPPDALRARLLSRRAAAEQVEAFLKVMPERYLRSARLDEAIRDLVLLRRARTRGFAARLHGRAGYSELVLAAPDRPGLLALFAGALAAHGIDILRARITSTADGWAVDSFAVRCGEDRLTRDRWRAARGDLLAALQGRVDVEKLLERRARGRLAARVVPRVETHVAVDNRASPEATVIDVYAQDRPGLLHAVARALHEQGAEILLAQVATEGHRAADGFYIRKITDPETLQRVESAVRRALAAPPAPAPAP